MGRVKPELLDRIEDFCHRAIDVADEIADQGRSRRVIEQLYGCSTSIGANASEADEALSRKDFCKCLGIAIKELSELRFWLRFVTRREWIAPARVTDLQGEAQQIKLILGSIISRTKERDSVS